MSIPDNSYVILYTAKTNESDDWTGKFSVSLLESKINTLKTEDNDFVKSLMIRLCHILPFLEEDEDAAQEFIIFTDNAMLKMNDERKMLQ